MRHLVSFQKVIHYQPIFSFDFFQALFCVLFSGLVLTLALEETERGNLYFYKYYPYYYPLYPYYYYNGKYHRYPYYHYGTSLEDTLTYWSLDCCEDEIKDTLTYWNLD